MKYYNKYSIDTDDPIPITYSEEVIFQNTKIYIHILNFTYFLFFRRFFFKFLITDWRMSIRLLYINIVENKLHVLLSSIKIILKNLFVFKTQNNKYL